MSPSPTIYVSSYYSYICVLILRLRPHTTTVCVVLSGGVAGAAAGSAVYVSAYSYYMCVLTLVVLSGGVAGAAAAACWAAYDRRQLRRAHRQQGRLRLHTLVA